MSQTIETSGLKTINRFNFTEDCNDEKSPKEFYGEFKSRPCGASEGSESFLKEA